MRIADQASGLLGGGFDIELEDDAIADEVIGFARELHVEVETVDGEFGSECDGVILDGNFGWEGDLFGDAVKGEVASDGGVIASTGDGGGFENGGWEFFNIEKIRRFEMAGEAIGVAPEGSSVDGDFGMSDGAVGDVDFALELLEAAIVFAGDFGAGEFDFGVFGSDDGCAGTDGGGGRGSGGTGSVRGGDIGSGDILGGIGTCDQEGGDGN